MFFKNLALIENFADSHFNNILRLLMFYQIFSSPQANRSAIITYKHGIFVFPH